MISIIIVNHNKKVLLGMCLDIEDSYAALIKFIKKNQSNFTFRDTQKM